MTRAVGFDLDNTLYDQTQHVFPFFSVAAAHLGQQTGILPAALERTFREAWNALGPAHATLFDTVLERHCIHDPKHVRVLVRMYHDYVGQLEVYTGVQPLLERLSERFQLFLITDGNAVMQRRKVARLGIEHLFRVVVLSAELGLGLQKPHPAPFVRALDLLQCAPDECLFAGDNPRADIGGAAHAGMKTVRVLTGPFAGDVVAGIEPDFVVGSVAQIDKVLR
jgi:putative hydrolase of the HAD superfamily